MGTQGPVSVIATALAALGNMVDTGNVLDALKVHLYQNNFLPTPQSVLADFTEADYVGYAAQAVGTWGAPYIDIDNLAHVTAPGLQFQPTDGTAPNVVYGVFVTNTAGTALVFAAQFVDPVPLTDATFAVVYEPDFIYGQ